MAVYKKYEHNPAHLFVEGNKYFITSATYQHRHYLVSDSAKQRVLSSIRKGFEENNWLLEDWVILDNHYHLMLDSRGNASLLPSIIRDIHKFTANWINKHDDMPGRKIWYNYWDKCITFEKSYFARLNYIWYNPVKHGICKNAEDYLFGSFRNRYFEEQSYMENLKSEYPWDNVKEFDV